MEFYATNLTDTVLTGATIESVVFDGDITGGNPIILTGMQSGGLIGTAESYPSSQWILVNGYLVGPGADLTGADLSNTDFSDVTDWAGTSFTNANFDGSTFSDIHDLNAAGSGASFQNTTFLFYRQVVIIN